MQGHTARIDIDENNPRPFPYEGMFAQAYYLYLNGFRYWFNSEERAEQDKLNEEFSLPNMERELILTYFRKPYSNEHGDFYTSSDIIEHIGGKLASKLTTRKVNEALRALGFKEHRKNWERGWICVMLTYEEVKLQRHREAMEAYCFSNLPDAAMLEDYGPNGSSDGAGETGNRGETEDGDSMNNFYNDDMFEYPE
jgi:hypothetical protein